MRSRRTPERVDWRLTQKVRAAIRDHRVFIGEHAEDRLLRLSLTREEFLRVVAGGVVLPERERDETGTATDGYKHFLEAVTLAGAIIEAVFKFVKARAWPDDELMILITAYRGRA